MRLFISFFIILSCSQIIANQYSKKATPFYNDSTIVGKYSPIEKFKRSRHATRLLRGQKFHFCFWYNPQKWKVEDRFVNLHEEINFSRFDNLGEATICAENVPTPPKEIKALVWEKAKETFDDVIFQREEIRNVNGHDLQYYQWIGINKNEVILANEYIFTNEHATIQITTFSEPKDSISTELEMEDFLNGLVDCP